MKIFKKKIILIWDFDAPIGQINSTLPYNFSFNNFDKEKINVKYALSKLSKYKIKTCFTITGFSAEKGSPPFNFPDFINEISKEGHEIASHNWKHEWIPLFTEDQIKKSLKRSKSILESAIEYRQDVVGFVPPHNKPATWIKRGAFSFGDRGLWPFFKMGNLENVFNLLIDLNYKWIRISHNPIKYKIGMVKRNITGKVYNYRGLLILENHYTGFDKKVCDHIMNSNDEYFIISAHPSMLGFEEYKLESSTHFEKFLEIFAMNPEFEFIRPIDLI